MQLLALLLENPIKVFLCLRNLIQLHLQPTLSRLDELLLLLEPLTLLLEQSFSLVQRTLSLMDFLARFAQHAFSFGFAFKLHLFDG